ncbi:sulfotransferase, partial [Streptomyces brasiliscabiei]|uniref:sulfotransferase n=1 Tax=Streptomyces brasiliscabiei TaxID=2736302 RepID=UPI003015085A
EFKNAYNAFIASKKNINQLVKYNADQHSQFCQQITKLSQQFPNTQTDTDFAPIFIVGMPRSGTTLMEKIINQSDQVQGVGELNDIAQLCQG